MKVKFVSNSIPKGKTEAKPKANDMSVSFFINTSYKLSELITKEYSTSFSIATSLLGKEERRAIFAIYGFVRLADEIVDSFHGYDKAFLLGKLKDDLYYALETGISTNPILAAFADTVNHYSIQREYIESFLKSMENDITKCAYSNLEDFEGYIYGSANVIGLMCLQIFCHKQENLFESLRTPAEKLGSAFQKVNFLRDINQDMLLLGRSYFFFELDGNELSQQTKSSIETSIENDFDEAWNGIKKLRGRSKLSVALAYYYYKKLFDKIKSTSCHMVMQQRIRISNIQKYLIIGKVFFYIKSNGFKFENYNKMNLYPKGEIRISNVRNFIVIFYIIGLLGFTIPFSKPIFIVITPLALLLNIYLLAAFHPKFDVKSLLVFLFVAVAGFFTEVIGVKTGLVFGNYVYGKGLGLKLFDTPLLIGLNWLFLTYCAVEITTELKMRFWPSVFIAPGLMLVYDFALEMVAPLLDMWSWNDDRVSLRNYVSWYVIAFAFTLIIKVFKIEIRNPLAMVLFACQLVFFVILALLLNP
jgi:Phytoene/squalene synthetase